MKKLLWVSKDKTIMGVNLSDELIKLISTSISAESEIPPAWCKHGIPYLFT